MDHLDLELGPEFRPKYFSKSDALRFSPGDDFFAFPSRPGCKWVEDTGKPEDSNLDINDFYQQWLYFGLLHTVLEGIRIENAEIVDSNRCINTQILHTWLLKWQETVGKPENRGQLAMRLIRAQLALDKARQIVSKLCDFDWNTWGPREDDNWGKVRGAIDKDVVLSLLVLGETLTNAKSKIIERLGYTIQGWHGNANEGWGVSAAVVFAMRNDGWCKRTIYVLAYQLRRHATALLAAKQAYRGIRTSRHSFHVLQGHDDCTKEECKFKSEDDEKNYKPRHRQDCEDSCCGMIGPEENHLEQAIEAGKIPLMRYNRSSRTVSVEHYAPGIIYTAISHVWSDGHGNRNESKLFNCQLEYLTKLIQDSRWHSNKNPLFWMDTLAIPQNGHARKIAVSRIDEVYRKARFTIVLDLGLDSMHPGTTYHDTALQVLASGWMRRLWTLQEAYLSRNIAFAFDRSKLIELDDLEEEYPRSTHHLTSNLATSARAYFFNIMGDERSARKGNMAPENKYDLIASVWRSAQWRTIHRKTDEPIVLEALFELNRKRAIAARGLPNGKRRLAITRHDIKNPHSPNEEDRIQLAKMMKELWIELEEQSPGCIPPGIIFLPGERLGLEGFGWAPRSWTIGKEIDYPDPLSLPQSTAKLIRGKGLCVQYPGFLMHCQNSRDVFWPKEPGTPYVQFPCDSTLDEWYKIRKAELLDKTAFGMALEKMRFAIILCRPKPQEREEIALLVNVVDETHTSRHGSSIITKVYKADIICRIFIQRAIGVDRSEELRQLMNIGDVQQGPGFICGEELPSNQAWIIDAHLEEKVLADEGQDEAAPNDDRSQTAVSTPSVPPDLPRIGTFIDMARKTFRPSFKGSKGRSK